MRIKEQPMISEHMDKSGIREGDRVYVEPLMGKRLDFLLQRTSIDFISPDLHGKLKSPLCKVLGSQRNESFHIRIKLIETTGKNKVKKFRYLAKVMKGGPIRLNGCYVLECFLEENDSIEIGFNRLKIKRNKPASDFDLQKKLILNNHRVVLSSLPILIEGETGVGKSSLAKKIHQESGRRGQFIHLNLSSFSANLIESELFGHVKGAFTGALNAKKGAFREADRGTLFIDEIDSLPIDIQTKLLTFLDSYSARPVGGAIEYKVDLRVIFSTGTELKNLVLQGKMRKDFYFRICSGHKFELHTLRDNSDLVRHFCELYMINNNISISSRLIRFYRTLPWPGNYRQLKGHLDRKQILSNSLKMDFDEIDEQLIEQSSELLEIKEFCRVSTLDEIKLAYATKIFYQSSCNYSHAAKKLNISIRCLRGLMKTSSGNNSGRS